MPKILTYTKNMPHEEWVQLRKKSIGGSDAAVITGLNPYRSSYTLWADKKGLIPDVSDNEAMRIGRDLEQYVAERFCEATGKSVRRRNAMFVHSDHDFITANIDREIVGENAGLECKTTNLLAKSDFEGGEIPLYYYCQCMHYMAVMGYEKMYLAVLVPGKAFYWYEIERNESEIESLINSEVEWWNSYMLTDEAPAPDGSESTENTLKAIYPESNGETTVYNSGLKSTAELYLKLKEKIKELEKTADTYAQLIMSDMAEAERCFMGRYEAIWKNQSRAALDSKRLKAEHPEIYKEYLKTTNYRKFSIKEAN